MNERSEKVRWFAFYDDVDEIRDRRIDLGFIRNGMEVLGTLYLFGSSIERKMKMMKIVMNKRKKITKSILISF